MRHFVIDASVFIKLFVSEPDSQLARSLRGRRFIAPDLLVAETANIVWKKVRRGELTTEEADLVMEAVENSGLDLSPSLPLMRRAFVLSLDSRHPAYDCFYLALAEQTSAPLVTADNRLIAVAETCGVTAISLSEAAKIELDP